MITLYFTRADVSDLVIGEWFDFLLMADAMGRSIGFLLAEPALALCYEDSVLVQRLNALSYTDLGEIGIGVDTLQPSILRLFSKSGVSYALMTSTEMQRALDASEWVISV